MRSTIVEAIEEAVGDRDLAFKVYEIVRPLKLSEIDDYNEKECDLTC